MIRQTETSSAAVKTPIAAATPRNNIIAVASGKGGVGKTWLSITLTHLFARSGRRVLLFDGDIGLANVDVQLGLTPKKDLGSVFFGQSKLSEVILPYEMGGFDIIAGRSGSASLSGLSVAQLDYLKKSLLEVSKNYDLVVLDLGAGIEQYVRFLSAIASRCLVVISDEPTSLTDAYAFIKLCHTNKHMSEIQIVVNQAATQKDGEKTFAALSKACSGFLGLNLVCAGIIRKDNKVKECIRAQTPMILKAPHSTAAADAAVMAIKLMQRD